MGATQSSPFASASSTAGIPQGSRPLELPPSSFSNNDTSIRTWVPDDVDLSAEEQGNLSDLIAAVLPRSFHASVPSSLGSAADGMSPLLVRSDPGLVSVLSVAGDPYQTWGDRRAIDFRPRVLTVAARAFQSVPPVRKHRRGAAPHKPLLVDPDETIHVSNLPPFSSKSELEKLDCSVCLNTWHRPVYTRCHHVFCSNCILLWLQQKSLCPLCRKTVRAADLRRLAVARKEDGHLRVLWLRHAALPTICPRCQRHATMREWERTCGRGNCPPAYSLDDSDKEVKPADSSSPDPPISEPQASLAECASKQDELVLWLTTHCPGRLTKLYVITHRMQNGAGAVGGLVLPGLKHTQAVLEFDPHCHSSSIDSEEQQLMWHRKPECCATSSSSTTVASTASSSISSSTSALGSSTDVRTSPKGKSFVSIEIFANQSGITWSVSACMPVLRSTSEKLLVWQADSSVEEVVGFILATRHRQYNLLTWNCQTYIMALRRHLGMAVEPTEALNIDLPTCEAPSLVRLLRETEGLGCLPGVQGADSNSRGEWCFTRVGQVLLALFDAEDLHRKGLYGVARIRRAVSCTDRSAEYEWLRYNTLPVLAFRLQRRLSSGNWRELGWVSAELRSDRGLLWHLYAERPQGLEAALAVASTPTTVSLEQLASAVEQLQDRRYNPLDWSGWDWAEGLASQVAPALFEEFARMHT